MRARQVYLVLVAEKVGAAFPFYCGDLSVGNRRVHLEFACRIQEVADNIRRGTLSILVVRMHQFGFEGKLRVMV